MNRALVLAAAVLVAGSVSVAAQWPKTQDPSVPRDAQGRVRYDAPPPRTADGRIDFSGVWARANSGAPGRGRGGRGGAPALRARRAVAPAIPAARRLRVRASDKADGAACRSSPPRRRSPSIPTARRWPPSSKPAATWKADCPTRRGRRASATQRLALNARDNPDAMCLPMGFLQFHQQPQPRKIYQTPKEILIEYEANYGLRHIYLDGRKLPPQGEPQPFWYGYSVGRWEGDTLVVETNNLRGAEDSPYDGWLDVNGSPYSQQAKFTERFRRLSYGQLQIDTTVEDPKAYTKPWTVRIDQRILPDEEMIEFVCNENQQFRRKVKID